MLLYSVIMFVVSGLFLWLSAMIYRGKTDLIHAYHQTKVVDRTAYGKAFGKALCPFAAFPFASGIIGLLGSSEATAWGAVAVLLAGLAIGIGCVTAVQRKYNKGIF